MRTPISVLSIFCCAAALGAMVACGDPQPPSNVEPPTDTTTTPPPGTYLPPTGTATNVASRTTAVGNPIQYYISVPTTWPGNHTWPVVITIAGAGRDWEENARRFATARDDRGDPFIIVTPIVLTNSGDAAISRDDPAFQYASSVWDLIDQEGRCAFDLNGLQAIIADVNKRFAGESKAYITGFSGGGHLGWATVFLKPQLLNGAALAASNYNGRCITNNVSVPQAISSAPERVLLPIRSFVGSSDPNMTQILLQQTVALGLATSNGYTNTSTAVVPNVAHDPLPIPVLTYFASLLKK